MMSRAGQVGGSPLTQRAEVSHGGRWKEVARGCATPSDVVERHHHAETELRMDAIPPWADPTLPTPPPGAPNTVFMDALQRQQQDELVFGPSASYDDSLPDAGSSRGSTLQDVIRRVELESQIGQILAESELAQPGSGSSLASVFAAAADPSAPNGSSLASVFAAAAQGDDDAASNGGPVESGG